MEDVHDAGGAIVAELEAALEHRHRGATGLLDDRPALRDQRVFAFLALAAFFAAFGAVLDGLDDVLGELGLTVLLGEELDDGGDFLLADEGALHAVERGAARRHEEHVAAADERLGAAAVEDGAGVDLRRHLEADARGQVGLDETGDDVRRRTLRGEHEVDAGGAGQLGDARDGGLDVLGGDHHEVGHLVDDADDVGQLLVRDAHAVVDDLLGRGDGRGQLVGAERELFLLGGAGFLGDLGVEAGDVLHAALGEDLVALRHLRDEPLEGGGHALGIGLDRDEQVREVVVDLQLDDLGVDHDETQVLRRAAVEERDDDRVDADRLALAGGAGDERVRHLGEVLDDGLVRDAVHAEHDGQLHRGFGPRLGFDDLAEEDVLAALVRDLDADGALARHGGQDAHGLGFEVHRDVVREVGDLLHAHAGGGLDLIAGDRRALLDADVDAVGGIDRHAVDLELLEGLDEVGGALAEILGRGLGAGGRLVEHPDLGEDVVAALLDDLARAGLLDLVGLHDEHLAGVGAERLGRLARRLGFGDFFFVLVFVVIGDGRRLGFLDLGRVGGDADVVRLDEVRAGFLVFLGTFVRDVDHHRDGLRDRLGGLLRLRDGHHGAHDFLLLAAEFGGGDVAAALFFGGLEGGGLTFGVPGAEAVAHLGDPGRKRGLRVVGEGAEQAEAVREDEDPGAVVEIRMEDRGEEDVAEQAAGALRIERGRGVRRGAEPERQDRREQDDAQDHQGDLERPERVRALIEGEPGRRQDEERDQEAGVAEEIEEGDGDAGAELAAIVIRHGDGRVLRPQPAPVVARVRDHRDEHEQADEREHGGEDGFALAGRAGERGGTFTGGSGHDYSPKRVPCEAASAAPGGNGSAWMWRGGRVTRAARARARSWARRSTMPARAWRIHFGVKEAAE